MIEAQGANGLFHVRDRDGSMTEKCAHQTLRRGLPARPVSARVQIVATCPPSWRTANLVQPSARAPEARRETREGEVGGPPSRHWPAHAGRHGRRRQRRGQACSPARASPRPPRVCRDEVIAPPRCMRVEGKAADAEFGCAPGVPPALAMSFGFLAKWWCRKRDFELPTPSLRMTCSTS